MLRQTIATLVLGLGGACGRVEPAPPPATSTPAPVAPTHASTPVAPPEPSAPELHDLLALASAHDRPALVGPWSALRLTPQLTVRVARRQIPALFEHPDPETIGGPFRYRSERWPDLAFEIQRVGQIDSDLEDWLVGELRVSLPATGVAERLTASWGPPRTRGDDRIWTNPEAHVRVVLDPVDAAAPGRATLTFGGYTPLAELIGTDPHRFGFEGDEPILGATGASLMKRFGRRIRNYSAIHLWPTETGHDTVVQFGSLLEIGDEDELAEFVVAGYVVTLDDGDAVAELLRKKFGAPQPDRSNESVLVYSTKPRVTFDGTELTVGKPLEQ